MKFKVDRRHLGRNLASIHDGHTIAELIKTQEDKDAKQKANTRNIPKMLGTPKRTKRIHFRRRILDTNSSSDSHSTASSCSTNSIYPTITLRTPHSPRPIYTLFSTPMARAFLTEALEASEAANVMYWEHAGAWENHGGWGR